MIASVHVADVGARSALSILRKPPDPVAVPGLAEPTRGELDVDDMITAGLGPDRREVTRPDPGRDRRESPAWS